VRLRRNGRDLWRGNKMRNAKELAEMGFFPNLVRFEPNLEAPFNDDDFLNDMFLYRIDNKLEKKYGRVSRRRPRRVQ
jgi:hypothetical protein